MLFENWTCNIRSRISNSESVFTRLLHARLREDHELWYDRIGFDYLARFHCLHAYELVKFLSMKHPISISIVADINDTKSYPHSLLRVISCVSFGRLCHIFLFKYNFFTVGTFRDSSTGDVRYNREISMAPETQPNSSNIEIPSDNHSDRSALPPFSLLPISLTTQNCTVQLLRIMRFRRP
jgi:hypothetical protein